ncbi:MAG: long-chain fatty acid--CoA ligase [Spirochaetaceae bacterium]|nr:MAG: long-chain fatty acid--CoA ligase [Spirochaetaceae bacterium]
MTDTIASASLEALARWGDHPCLVTVSSDRQPQMVSAAELQSFIIEAARQLAGWGVRRAVPVALYLENSVDYVVILLALARLGAVAVPGKLDYRAMELSEFFANANPPLVISETAHLPVLGPFLADRTVVARSAAGLTLSQAGRQPLEEAAVPDDTASINYTYRGCGYPLGALVSHQQYLHGARVLQDGLQARRGDRMLYSIPMSHIFTLVGCIMVPLLYGITGVIARTIHPRLLFDAIAGLRIQHVTAVPELYALMRRAKSATVTLPSLEAFVSGGSVLTADEYQALRQTFGVEVLHGYGLTEFTPVSRNSRGQARAGTVGPICEGVDCRIESCGDSGDGEILVRGPTVSCGYYRRDAETRQAWNGTWFRTGDSGRLAGDHLVFLGEIKPTCKINGVMVDLHEVDRAFYMHPDIKKASVSAASGSLVAEVIVSSRCDPEEKVRQLKAFLKHNLAAYKVPRTINLIA